MFVHSQIYRVKVHPLIYRNSFLTWTILKNTWRTRKFQGLGFKVYWFPYRGQDRFGNMPKRCALQVHYLSTLLYITAYSHGTRCLYSTMLYWALICPTPYHLGTVINEWIDRRCCDPAHLTVVSVDLTWLHFSTLSICAHQMSVFHVTAHMLIFTFKHGNKIQGKVWIRFILISFISVVRWLHVFLMGIDPFSITLMRSHKAE